MDVGDYYTIPRVCSCGSSRVKIVGTIGLEIVYECARCASCSSCIIDTFLTLIGFDNSIDKIEKSKCTCDIVQLWNTGQHKEGCYNDA